MSNASKTHDALVADWQQNTEKHDDDNYRFLRSLKQKSFKKVDRIALELHQEAFGIVDCTRCANCCRTLRRCSPTRTSRGSPATWAWNVPSLSPLTSNGTRNRAAIAKTTPCPFLGEDSKCTIYDVRPEKCRGYPFTDKPDCACLAPQSVCILHATSGKRAGFPGKTHVNPNCFTANAIEPNTVQQNQNKGSLIWL